MNAAAESIASATPQPDLDALLKDVQALEGLMAEWDEGQRNTVQALRCALDALNKEALARLIRTIKTEPVALGALKAAVADEVVYAVLRHHELIKPSLHERVEQALDEVRPMLASHGGNVELVSIEPPDTVEIRLLGACDGCPASGLTLSEGVEKAIHARCPEITHIHKAKGLGGAGVVVRPGEPVPIRFVSPFARGDETGWQRACHLAQVPEGDVRVFEVAGESVLIGRFGERVVCYQNACAHAGMPLDLAAVEDGVLTCPHHGFKYALDSGECLTLPEVQLHTHAVRVRGNEVEVRLN